MSIDEFEKLLEERGEVVLVDYFKELDIYSFRLMSISLPNNWQKRFWIDNYKKCYYHEEYEYILQFDDDFVYFINNKNISLPLTPFMLHFANESAKDQKEIRQYLKKQQEKEKNRD